MCHESFQELQGETWQFKEFAMAFVDGELVGGPDEFISWATDNANYEDFRPPGLYETLAEEEYVDYLNSKKVTISTKRIGLRIPFTIDM